MLKHLLEDNSKEWLRLSNLVTEWLGLIPQISMDADITSQRLTSSWICADYKRQYEPVG